jgi:predicted nucleotidyltransferase
LILKAVIDKIFLEVILQIIKPTQENVNEILERLKETSPAVRIILFGSWAWGVSREDSDIDVLVIEKNGKILYAA